MTTFYRTLGLALFVSVVVPVAAQEPQVRVTLLGTGCPPAVMNRFGPSTFVEAGGQKFLFDTGRGALQRLVGLGVQWQDVQGVFFTHLHSDHVVGFPDLWLTGWLIVPGRNVPLPVPERVVTVQRHGAGPVNQVFSWTPDRSMLCDDFPTYCADPRPSP